MKVLIFIFAVICYNVLIAPTVQATTCGTYMDSANLLLFYPDSIDLYTKPTSPAYAGYFDFQGLRFQIASNGQLQVIELGNNNLVWAVGLTNKLCNSQNNCHLVFQSDGNLVIYYADGSAWGTGTYNMNAAYVLFQTTSPYITIINSTCYTLWPNAGSRLTVGPSARTTAVSGPTRNVNVNTNATPSNKWREQFAVNTHCSQGWSSQMVYDLTTYLGVSTIRDSIPSASQAADYIRLKQAGVKLNIVANGVANKTGLNQLVQSWATYQQSNPGMITSIEGFNEINNFGFTYNGINPSSTYAGMFQAMSDLYTTVKNNPILSSVPVWDMTGACFSNGQSLGCGNYTGRADFGTIHTYPYSGQPSVCVGDSKNEFTQSIAHTYPVWTSTSNFVCTETGYHSDTFGNGVTEAAHGVMIVNTLLNAVRFQMKKTFIYELIDEVWSGYNGPESHFGIFRNDKTPKPAARALHFLSSLLNDTNGGSGSLMYTLNNLPVGASYQLFQRASLQFVLVVWNNSPVYNPVTMADIINSPVTVTLTVTTSKNFNLYNIYDTTASDKNPLPAYASTTGTSVNFSLGNQAVVITF